MSAFEWIVVVPIIGFMLFCCAWSVWAKYFASQDWRCRNNIHDLGEEYVGIHSALHMGCHKQDCMNCGVTMEHWPA